MRYKIHFQLADDSEDSIILEGDTIEEIQVKAKCEVDKRNAIDAWSEEIK